MRYSSLLAAALATAPLTVSATGSLGFALGSRLENGTCKGKDDYAADLSWLKTTTTSRIVRTYAGVDGGDPGNLCYVPSSLLPAAADQDFKVVLGIWADSETAFNTDVADFMANATKNVEQIYAVTVGSETLYRYQQDPTTGLSADDLLSRIQSFQQTLDGKQISLKVGTAESWNKYQDGTANPIIPHVDILLVNAFGYWQQQQITNASATFLDDLQQAYGQIQSVAGSTTSIELWVGETGWPTDGGDSYGAATAGTTEAFYFWKQGVCAALDWDFNVFYFEAFDEPWKPDATGADGQPGDEKHWGAFGADRSTKFPSYNCDYLVPATS